MFPAQCLHSATEKTPSLSAWDVTGSWDTMHAHFTSYSIKRQGKMRLKKEVSRKIFKNLLKRKKLGSCQESEWVYVVCYF